MISKDSPFRYAQSDKGAIIHISKVNESNRHNKYYCISCGCELEPVLGLKKAHHFRHKTNACSYESYLHKLAKKMLKLKFDMSDKFEIVTQPHKTCEKLHCCPFFIESECYVPDEKPYDLKKNGLYDLCQEEQSVSDGRFVADLLITNNSNTQKPVLIEIFVTHKSTEEKRNSEFPIIEIQIDNEDQIDDLIANPIGHKDSKYNIKYFNFKKTSNSHCSPSDNKFPLDKFTVFKSGKYYYTGLSYDSDNNNTFDCSKLNEPRKENTQIEIALPRYIREIEAPLLYCYKKNIKTCYCKICYFLMSCFSGEICKLYKTKHTPHYPLDEHPICCEYFKLNVGLEETLKDIPILELPASF